MLMATSEVRRAKVRFVLLTMGAGLLVFVQLFQQMLLDGIMSGLTGAIRHQSGEVIVFGASAARSVAFSIRLPDDTQKSVTAHPDVESAGSLKFTGMTAKAASGKLVDLSLLMFESGRPGGPTQLASGRMPANGHELLVDSETSRNSFAIGDTVVFTPTGYTAEVVGYTAGSQLNLGPTFWTTQDAEIGLRAAVERLFKETGVNQGFLAQELLVASPRSGVSAETLAAELDQLGPQLDIVTREVAADSAPGIKEAKLAFGMILGLGYLVVGIVIGFFFLTLTLQKASSLTLLRAVGAPNRYLVRSLLQQVLLVTVGGVGVGVLMLLGSYLLLHSSAPVSLRVSTMAASGGLALGVALLGAVPPVRRILRTDPHDVVGRPTMGGLT